MRTGIILRYIGGVILLNAVFMFVSALVSAAAGPDTAFYTLLLSAILSAAVGSFPLIFVRKSDQLTTKEGYSIVVGAWIASCFLGTFPYLLWGGEFGSATAWFESVSGFTTTGATALQNIDIVPDGLLFWRSSTHWLGGIGVVMFALIIMPKMGRTKMTLSSVELSPLARDNYRYKTSRIIRILLGLYVGMTLVETVLLKYAGMSWFDAVNHSFSTIATGGFSTHNQSIGYFESRRIEAIIGFFMLVSGLHFGLVFATVVGRRNNIFRSEVARFYLLTIAVTGLLIGLSLWQGDLYPTAGGAFRAAYFHVVSYITTTGFITTDTNLWPPFAIVLLIFLMFQCGCAGSTSGGIKSDRILLAAKALRAQLIRQQHPDAIIRIKLNGQVQDSSLVGFAMLFIVVYLLVVLFSTMVFTAVGMDLSTGFSMAVSCMGNVGPGFGEISAANDYSAFTPFVKFYCSVLMLLGRLEIFGLIQLFLLKWWK